MDQIFYSQMKSILVVIDTKSYFHAMKEQDSVVHAQAGIHAKGHLVVSSKTITGFSFMAGIPGSIGAVLL